MMKAVFFSILLYIFFSLQTIVASTDRTNRFEIDYSLDTLVPSKEYKEWHTVIATNYQKITNNFTLFYQAGTFQRESGNAILGSIGAYTTWNETFYTYSQLTLGSSCDYLPRIRVDNDLNYKLGKTKNTIFTLGLSYIDAYDNHSDKIISTAITHYGPKYNATYRIFQNHSDPGDIISYTQLFSLNYGEEKKEWLTVNISLGDQAYLSTITSNDIESRQNSSSITVGYRKWTDDHSGLYGDIGYQVLKDSYSRSHFKIGFFYEY